MSIRAWIVLATVLFGVVLTIAATANYIIRNMSHQVDFGNGQLVTSYPLRRVNKNSSAMQNKHITSDELTCFHSAFYGGLDRWSELRIDKSGEAVLTSFVGQGKFIYKQARFRLEDYEISELCTRLRAANFAQLNDLSDSYISDGRTYSMTLHCQGLSKEVVCVDHYPRQFANLEKYIRENILTPHQLEIDNAVEITQEEANKSLSCLGSESLN